MEGALGGYLFVHTHRRFLMARLLVVLQQTMTLRATGGSAGGAAQGSVGKGQRIDPDTLEYGSGTKVA